MQGPKLKGPKRLLSDLLAHFSTVSTNTFNGWYNMSRAFQLRRNGRVAGRDGVVLRYLRAVRRG